MTGTLPAVEATRWLGFEGFGIRGLGLNVNDIDLNPIASTIWIF